MCRKVVSVFWFLQAVVRKEMSCNLKFMCFCFFSPGVQEDSFQTVWNVFARRIFVIFPFYISLIFFSSFTFLDVTEDILQMQLYDWKDCKVPYINFAIGFIS